MQTVLAPQVSSLRVSLLHREVEFFHGLLASPSLEVTVAALLLARDLRSTAGANLALVREVSGLDPWTAGKRKLQAALEAADQLPVPPKDSRRIPVLHKLLSARLTAHYHANTEEEVQLHELIDSIVIN